MRKESKNRSWLRGPKVSNVGLTPLSLQKTVYGIVAIWTLTLRSVFAQTPAVPIKDSLTPVEQNIQMSPTTSGESDSSVNEKWLHMLFVSGFPDEMPKVLLPTIKVSLNLTDDQMDEIKKLDILLTHFRQMESHTLPSQEDPRRRSECIKGAVQLRNILGAEKFEDFCQWVGEESTIKRFVNGLNNKNVDTDDVSDLSDKIFKKVEKNYKIFNENKALQYDSKDASKKYFLNHDKNLKLQILFEIYGNQYPFGGGKINDDKRKNLDLQRKKILNEMNSDD